MDRLRTVVVGVDFSAYSRKALQQAVRIAHWNEAWLHVIHVIDRLVVLDPAEVTGGLVADVRAQAIRTGEHEVRACLSELGSDGAVAIVVGLPIDEILRLVRAESADLLVIGANGTSLPHQGSGTLAVQCLRKVPTKVLLVGLYAGESFRIVVAAIDFSDTAALVVGQARPVAACDKSAIHFVHVYDPSWNRLHCLVPTPEVNPDFRRQCMSAMQGRLEEFVGSRTEDPGGRCALFPHQRFGTAIAEYARQIGADLIVVGARGRTNLRYVLTGTTAERLLRDLPCSVVAVRAVQSCARDDKGPPRVESDALAAAAVLVMGEGSEATPLAVISDVPFVVFQDRDPSGSELEDLRITPGSDLYAPLHRGVPWQTTRVAPCLTTPDS